MKWANVLSVHKSTKYRNKLSAANPSKTRRMSLPLRQAPTESASSMSYIKNSGPKEKNSNK